VVASHVQRGASVAFSYSFDNQKFTIPLGGEFIGSQGRGSRKGRFVRRGGTLMPPRRDFAVFDWFHVEPLERKSVASESVTASSTRVPAIKPRGVSACSDLS